MCLGDVASLDPTSHTLPPSLDPTSHTALPSLDPTSRPRSLACSDRTRRSARRCGPCQQIAPVFAQLSTKYTEAVFIKVNADRCPMSKAAMHITAFPTFVFAVPGNPVPQVRRVQPQRPIAALCVSIARGLAQPRRLTAFAERAVSLLVGCVGVWVAT